MSSRICMTTFVLSVQLLQAIAPRATLTHFERDLQKMAKSSKIPAAPAGSFVDRLASKRRQKEVIEQELAKLQQEVDLFQHDVVRLEGIRSELELATAAMHGKIEQQKVFAQHISIQLETEMAELRTTQP